MKFLAVLSLLGSLQLICGDSADNATRSTDNEDLYSYFATRTVYDVVRKDIVRPESSCKPVQIWMLARHGTRYPSKSDTKKIRKLVNIRDEIIANHKSRAGHLEPSVVERLSDWHQDPHLKLESAKKLAPQGKRDLQRLAKRLRDVFPELLKVDPQHVKQRDFLFRATDTERTKSSLKAFARGLFGTSKQIVRPQEPPANDTLLMAPDNCPAWEERYWAEHYDAESNKFAAGPEVDRLVENVNLRLGFNRTLDYGLVRTMYDACRFETAWHPGNRSTWCSLFANDDLRVLEYQEDLDHYYYCGPGRQWNVQLGCQPLRDMIARFKKVVDGEAAHPKGVFYFAHTVTLQTFMAALSVDGGSSRPLLAENYSSSRQRRFRTSLLGAFASNVIAVLYQCDGSESAYSVAFYTAERLERIDGCRDGLCDWDFVERKFRQQVESCSMSFC